MQLRQFFVDVAASRSFVDAAVVACAVSVAAMQTDHVHPPAVRDGYDGKRDVTRELCDALLAATRDVKNAEDMHRLVVHETARAAASHAAAEREMVTAATDAERTLTPIRDSVRMLTERLRGCGAHVRVARSATELAIAATNGHAAAENRFARGRRAYAEALVALAYVKASVVVALCDEDAVAAEATRLSAALDQCNLNSMNGELVVALEHITPKSDFIVARNDVCVACRCAVSVYADLAADTELIAGNYVDVHLDNEIELLVHQVP